jgi:hypothetical protein
MDPLVDHAALPWAGPVVFMQTAAGPAYEAMLTATDAWHRAYCAAHALSFNHFVGIRRGVHAWQASFNRVEMLADLLDDDFAGWVAYLDADAVIRQPGFDLRRYLGKRYGAALIAAPGGPERWNINDGVFFLNLGHPHGRAIARRWRESVHDTISEALLRDSPLPWQVLPDGRAFPDDQHLLQMVLRDDHTLSAALLVERGGLINLSNGRFIRQFLRTDGTPGARRAELLATIAEARDAMR